MKYCSRCAEVKPEAAFGKSHRWCLACRRDYAKAQREKHGDRIRARDRDAYHKDLERSRAISKRESEKKRRRLGMAIKNFRTRAERAALKRTYMKVRYLRRREYLLAQNREWAQKNPGKVIDIANRYRRDRADVVATRRARRRGADTTDPLTANQWNAILEFYGFKCARCAKPASEAPLTIDHYIPIARGGAHTFSNVWPLCRSCNCKKHSQVPAGVPPHVTVLLITTQAKGAHHESSG